MYNKYSRLTEIHRQQKATKKIMFLMKEIENREGTLEVQEELFRLEQEKTITLGMPL
jgi:hypothetical protein